MGGSGEQREELRDPLGSLSKTFKLKVLRNGLLLKTEGESTGLPGETRRHKKKRDQTLERHKDHFDVGEDWSLVWTWLLGTKVK